LKKLIVFILFLSAVLSSSCAHRGIANFDHTVQNRNDGGYTLSIQGTIRALAPITPEGFFPKRDVSYHIELVGEGENLRYRNHPGFYYPFPEKVHSNKQHWDFGYVWVDENKEYIYINLYWLDSPDGLTESDINGKYKVLKD